MRIAIFGCGNMGKAIAARLSETHDILLYDRNADKTEKLEKEGHGTSCKDMQEALLPAEIIILAIKPQNLKDSASEIARYIHKGQLLVSLLTGTTLDTLKDYFPNVSLVRMMPNLALLYGEGVIGLCVDKETSTEDTKLLTRLFEPLGKTYLLPEEKMNALTALTGSGPAFIFVMAEAMIDAGIAMGLTSKNSQELVYQMLRGSLALLEETQKHPGELKWQITSPGGTTIAGLRMLEEQAVRGGIINTFLAAYERANELT
jgi:pyrroline-5-carboxylate reductase